MEPVLGVLIVTLVRVGIPIAVLTAISVLYSQAQLRHRH